MATPKKTSDKAPAKKAAPAAKKAATAKKTTAAPKKAAPAVVDEAKNVDLKDTFTPEELARLEKIRETMAMLAAEPDWASFIEEQTELLHRERETLVPNMQSVTRDHLRSGASNVSSSSGQHIGDAGSEAEVRNLTIRLLDKDREQLFEIDAALDRIRRGTYGICEMSLEAIPRKRLQARPACRLTVKCQEEYEKKYGTASAYRSPNSDIIGYAGVENDSENAISLDERED